MAKDAIGKLREADLLDKEAIKIKGKDPVNSVRLQGLAHKKRSSAVKQLSRRPRAKKSNRLVI